MTRRQLRIAWAITGILCLPMTLDIISGGDFSMWVVRALQ